MDRDEIMKILESGSIEDIRKFYRCDFHKVKHTPAFGILICRLKELTDKVARLEEERNAFQTQAGARKRETFLLKQEISRLEKENEELKNVAKSASQISENQMYEIAKLQQSISEKNAKKENNKLKDLGGKR